MSREKQIAGLRKGNPGKPQAFSRVALVCHPVTPEAQMNLADIMANIDFIIAVHQYAKRPMEESAIELRRYMTEQQVNKNAC